VIFPNLLGTKSRTVVLTYCSYQSNKPKQSTIAARRLLVLTQHSLTGISMWYCVVPCRDSHGSVVAVSFFYRTV